MADSNLWLAMAIPPHPFHAVVRDWWSSRSDALAFCRSTQQSFLRHLTNVAMFERYGLRAYTNAEAWTFFHTILNAPKVVIVNEPAGVLPVWERFSQHRQPSPKLWMDAYLAAFAVAADIEFVTTDGGFRQFPGLKLTLLTLPKAGPNALPP